MIILSMENEIHDMNCWVEDATKKRILNSLPAYIINRLTNTASDKIILEAPKPVL